MIRRLFVLVALCCLVSSALLAGKRRAVSPPRHVDPTPVEIGQPLPGLPPSLLARFERGRDEFARVHTVEDGLGPVVNETSCGACHGFPVLGGNTFATNVQRFGTIKDGRFDPLVELGGPLLQARGTYELDGATHVFHAEVIPREATIVATRRTPPLFGLSLVDATPDATFIALAAQQAARNDGTAGRVAMVDNLAAGMQTVGKFGWKAQIPTLFQFAGDAYLNELGVTSPFFPNENCPSGRCEELKHNPRPGLNDTGGDTQALTDFLMFLAPPPRGPITPDVLAGEAIFQRIGCESCHVSTLQTGDHPVAALHRVTYHPYSDFLLHDMGTMGDRIEQGAASGTEMRTPPLWGIRFRDARYGGARYLTHDGRAPQVEGAIAAHAGQGAAARIRFQQLNATERRQLIAFVDSL
jgi:CxxC motif-containing protein (DUF1111 family)